MAACTASPDPGPTPAGAHGPTAEVETVDYLPGLAADLYPPDPVPSSAAVVVLIPGGGWQTADRSGLAPLAQALADRGAYTVNATYPALDSGGSFPETVDAVACALRFGATRARDAGIEPSSVTLVGHSAGGHLAALAVLGGDEFGGDCPYPAVSGAALVGLAGVYDTSTPGWLPDAFVGASREEDPQSWARANPISLLRGQLANALSVLLLHGADDAVVPPAQSETFQMALREAGARVRLVLVPHTDHLGIIAPDASADTIAAFVGAGSPATAR
jgi:acetyl esterase/lipase